MARIHEVVPYLLTLEQTAQLIGVSASTLRGWLTTKRVNPAPDGLVPCMTIEPPPMADIGFRSFAHVDDIVEWKWRYRDAIEAAGRPCHPR